MPTEETFTVVQIIASANAKTNAEKETIINGIAETLPELSPLKKLIIEYIINSTK